jgi:type I site-specific restriction endonuclease
MKPEERAKQKIDKLLEQAGWSFRITKNSILVSVTDLGWRRYGRWE